MNVLEPIRVMCVDDHAFMLEGLRARIEAEPGFSFVGGQPSLEGLTAAVREAQPDVLLLDIELPGSDVFQVMAELSKAAPKLRIVMFSAYVRDHYIDKAVQAGAWGYLAKTDHPDMIIEGLRRAARGEPAFGPEIMERVRLHRGEERDPSRPASKLHALTPREQQILRMIGKGQSRTEIARAIHRSPKTVDAHRASIMEKLNIHDRVELARYAIREGLVEV